MNNISSSSERLAEVIILDPVYGIEKNFVSGYHGLFTVLNSFANTSKLFFVRKLSIIVLFL